MGEGQMILDGTNKYRQAWHYSNATEDFLKSMLIGNTLEVCCGISRLGDTTLDIDKNLKPDILGDMEEINNLVSPLSYDTILWDAPFTWYYKLKNYTSTLKKMVGIARKRIIVVGSNLFAPGVKGWRRSLYWGVQEANTRVRFVWIYDRTDEPL